MNYCDTGLTNTNRQLFIKNKFKIVKNILVKVIKMTNRLQVKLLKLDMFLCMYATGVLYIDKVS